MTSNAEVTGAPRHEQERGEMSDQITTEGSSIDGGASALTRRG